MPHVEHTPPLNLVPSYDYNMVEKTDLVDHMAICAKVNVELVTK